MLNINLIKLKIKIMNGLKNKQNKEITPISANTVLKK